MDTCNSWGNSDWCISKISDRHKTKIQETQKNIKQEKCYRICNLAQDIQSEETQRSEENLKRNQKGNLTITLEINGQELHCMIQIRRNHVSKMKMKGCIKFFKTKQNTT